MHVLHVVRVNYAVVSPVQTSTFQAILATNGETFFVVFIYGMVNTGRSREALAFFSNPNFTIPHSSGAALMEGSNVGVPGIYIFKVESSTILSAGECIDSCSLLLLCT